MSTRTNRFRRTYRNRSLVTQGRSRSATRSTSVSGQSAMSAASTSGRTSMKAPIAILKKKNVTIKDKLRNIEKTLRTDEVKYLLTTRQSLNVLTTPNITLLNPMARGDTIQTRTADSVRALALEVSGHMKTAAYAEVRIMVVADKRPEGSTIQFSAVTPAKNYMFAGASGAPIVTSAMMNFNNTSLDTEFRVFYDKTFSLSNSNVYAQNFSIKCKIDVECEYKNGNAGDITDLTKNALYLIIWGNDQYLQDPTYSGVYTIVHMDHCLYFKDA